MNLEEKAIKFIHTVANATDKPLFAGNSGGKDSAVIETQIYQTLNNLI